MHTRHVIAIIMVFGILVGAAWFVPRAEAPTEQQVETQATNISATQLVANIAPSHTSEVPSGTTALTFLVDTMQKNDISVTTKTFVGLGTMVESIGNLTNGTDDKYWQYYVNGTLAPVGADAYEIQEGDAIEWRFAAPDLSY